MRIKCVLIVDENETVLLRKTMPERLRLRSSQLVIPLTITVPDAWFTTYRTAVLAVDVPPPNLPDIEVAVGEPRPPLNPGTTLGLVAVLD